MMGICSISHSSLVRANNKENRCNNKQQMNKGGTEVYKETGGAASTGGRITR